jgi:hypothetical protein
MAAEAIEHPYYPIIFVRGYAGTDDEVEDTVSDPYMGFNLGSTKLRTLSNGRTDRHYFESPLVRLMKDHGYRDVYSAGINATDIDGPTSEPISPRSVIIYRYYDLVSSIFGEGKQVKMEQFGQGLNNLIEKLRQKTCSTAKESKRFKVYLVGHSMGGLVIRCFLQNEKIGDPEIKACVDKVFTYATPHKGIDFEIVGNVPAFFTLNSADNFNRKRMQAYLGFDGKAEEINSLDGKFDPERFFCLIGTNAKDYAVAKGWSSRVVGPHSDGLVRINSAVVIGRGDKKDTTKIGPRAYVHRSHSGYYGIVNSEEGYQNLVRFLFGNVRVDGVLELNDLTLPKDIQAEQDGGKKIGASYHFEAVTRVRGTNWDLSRRVASENSTVFRKLDELFPPTGKKRSIPEYQRRPEIFTGFLSRGARVDKGRPSLGFCVDLGVLVPDYEVDGTLWLKNHYAGGYVYRDKINLEAFPAGSEGEDWVLRYGFDSVEPNGSSQTAERKPIDNGYEFRIPIVQKTPPGIEATLIVTARAWNPPPG